MASHNSIASALLPTAVGPRIEMRGGGLRWSILRLYMFHILALRCPLCYNYPWARQRRKGNVSFIWNTLKALVAFAMIIGVVTVGVFIFASTNFSFGASGDNSNSPPVMFTIQPGDKVSTVAD